MMAHFKSNFVYIVYCGMHNSLSTIRDFFPWIVQFSFLFFFKGKIMEAFKDNQRNLSVGFQKRGKNWRFRRISFIILYFTYFSGNLMVTKFCQMSHIHLNESLNFGVSFWCFVPDTRMTENFLKSSVSVGQIHFHHIRIQDVH